MRILIIIHGYPPTYKGGAELRAERTARALAERHHDVAVLCVESLTADETRLEPGEQLQDGVQVYRLHVKSFAALAECYDDQERHVVSQVLEQLILAWRPDLIHLFSGYLMGSGVIMTAKAHQIPMVVSLTDYWWLCHRINLVQTNGRRCEGPTPVECARCQREIYRRFRLPANMARPLADCFWQMAGHVPMLRDYLGVNDQTRRLEVLLAALNQADALIAPSQFLADMYVRHNVNAALIHVWRQGVNLNLCPLRKPSPVLRFSYLGQLKHHKGIHTLIDAWALLDSAHPRSLTLYGSSHGEDSYGAYLHRRAQQLEGVIWNRSITHSEVWQVLAETDILVIPSRWYENSPNVILEAQAMGIPVIGTNLGGIAELVHHGRNGLLFTPDSAVDLATQMARLLNEPGLLSTLQEHPIRFHSFQDELEQVQDLYRQLTAHASIRPILRTEALSLQPDVKDVSY